MTIFLDIILFTGFDQPSDHNILFSGLPNPASTAKPCHELEPFDWFPSLCSISRPQFACWVLLFFSASTLRMCQCVCGKELNDMLIGLPCQSQVRLCDLIDSSCCLLALKHLVTILTNPSSCAMHMLGRGATGPAQRGGAKFISRNSVLYEFMQKLGSRSVKSLN